MTADSHNPLVSVLMPVYRVDDYLAEAIESILHQSLGDFELIIVCDEPTERTKTLIGRYCQRDPRIIPVFQEKAGLAESLNRGCSVARGRYIARMDGDDISHPERLRKEVEFLESHPLSALVASFVTWIDESGSVIGNWTTDRTADTAEKIRRTLPRENCIAHPTVMIRTDLLRQYRYDPRQANTEDYDLWLRLASANYRIDKLPEALVQLRIHRTSVMKISKTLSPGSDRIACKIRYLAGQIRLKNCSGFNLSVLFFLLVNMAVWPFRLLQVSVHR